MTTKRTPKRVPWGATRVVALHKRPAALFYMALLMSGCTTRLRVVSVGRTWYFHLPPTQAAAACWLGFSAGKPNTGYQSGSFANLWPTRPDTVIHPPPKPKPTETK